VVVAVAERDENVAVPVGMLVSDSAGYVSFDLTELHEAGLTLRRLWLCPSNDTGARIDIARNCLLMGEAGLHFVLEVDARSMARRGSPTSLASVQNPEAADWKISPHSFSAKQASSLGEDGCSTPYPSNFADRDYRFYRVVRNPDTLRRTELSAPGRESGPIGQALTAVNVDPLGSLAQGLRTSIAWGQVFEFRQRWIPLSHSLGQISYSLSLAPCESVNLAVVDWSRGDMATRTDQVKVTENLLHNQYRDRTIDETVKAGLDESQGGFSVLGGLAAAATGLTTGGIAWGAAAAMGASVAHSSGDRNTEAHSTQELHDHVKQATVVTRSLNSTVIAQGTQQEQNALETRTITNHNHCHALTVQYYEVLRNFRLVTAFEGKRPVVLIPFALVTFTWTEALRFRELLESVLLNPALAPCFDAMERLKLCPDVYELLAETGDPGVGAGQGVEDRKISGFSVTLSTTTYNPGGTKGAIWVNVWMKSAGNWETIWEKGVAPPDLSQVTWPQIVGGKDISVGDIDKVQVAWKRANSADVWDFKGITIVYQITGEPGDHTLIEMTGSSVATVPHPSDSGLPALAFFGYEETMLSAPPLPVQPAPPLPSPSKEESKGKPKTKYSKQEDSCCTERLLSHLTANTGFYSRAIWVLQDPVERRILLDDALQGYPQIRDGLDETPLAVSGNCVAFACDPPLTRPLVGPDPSQDSVVVTPSEDIVSIPTRGLFAEAQLGHCNSCEVRDVTRFWKWEESPCDKPPSIEGITPGPHGQPASLQPANLPAPVVQVMQPPAAPDPVGLAAAMKLLGQPNIFRDMSGEQQVAELLNKLSSGAVDLAGAQQLASKAVKNLGSGGTGASDSWAATSPEERFDNLQVLKAAKEQGLITNDEARRAAAGQVGGTDGTSDAGTLDDKAGVVSLDFDQNTTVGQRAFSPGNYLEARVADASGVTTMRATVRNAPAGATYAWSLTPPGAGRILATGALTTQVECGDPGLATISFAVQDGAGKKVISVDRALCVPQFVVVDEDAAAFDVQLASYRLKDVKTVLLERTRAVVDLLLRNANVRVLWRVAPFNNALPPQFLAGGGAAGKYNQLTIHGSPPMPGLAGATGAAGVGPVKPNEKIDVWPGAYTSPASDVGPDVAAFVTKLASMNVTDPQIKSLWIDAVSRLLGETMAHEIHHALLGTAGFDGGGHNLYSIPWDLMNRGIDRTWVQRTGIEVVDPVAFPAPGSYRDGGLPAISGLVPASGNQAKVDAVFPVPPAFT
jgi:hypothetical protein